MNRTIKDATIKTYHYDDLENLKAHVMAFATAYNFAKHLKALKWQTPYQAICEAWTKDPSSSRSTRAISFRDHTVSQAQGLPAHRHAIRQARQKLLTWRPPRRRHDLVDPIESGRLGWGLD